MQWASWGLPQLNVAWDNWSMLTLLDPSHPAIPPTKEWRESAWGSGGPTSRVIMKLTEISKRKTQGFSCLTISSFAFLPAVVLYSHCLPTLLACSLAFLCNPLQPLPEVVTICTIAKGSLTHTHTQNTHTRARACACAHTHAHTSPTGHPLPPIPPIVLAGERRFCFSIYIPAVMNWVGRDEPRVQRL